MTISDGATAMDEVAIKKKIGELCRAILALPRGRESDKAAPDQASDFSVYHPKTSTKAGSIEDSLDHLRLHVKYLMFDLEATRRENRYLRQMIDNRRRRPNSEDSGGSSDF